LAFPAPSSTFCRCRPGPRGVPFRRPFRPKPEPTTLMTLASPSKLSLERWSRLAAGPPLVRFACPSTDISRARPLPGASSLRLDSATCRARSVRVVSHHLDGLLRTRARGFVAPRSRSGFAAFRLVSEPVPSEDGGGPPRPLPAARVHTLRRVSSSTAGAASLRSVALLSLPAHVSPSPRPKPRRAMSPGTAEPKSSAHGSRGVADRPKPESDPLARAVISSTVKLRSAANGGPPRHRGTGAPASRRPIMRGPPPRRRRSDEASDGRVPDGAACPPSAERGTSRAIPESILREPVRRPKPRTTPWHARFTEVSRADSSRRRERPTTRPCSVDESVVSHHRCRRFDTRSFHGLCSPPRSTRVPLQPGPCRDRADIDGPKPATPSAQAAVEAELTPMGSLRRLPLVRPTEVG